MQSAFSVYVTNRQQSFVVAAGQSVLCGMEKACSRAIEVGCRGGGCGLCKVRVLQGRYSTGRMSRRQVSEQEQAAGFALACRLLPESDLVLESDQFMNTQPGKAAQAAQ